MNFEVVMPVLISFAISVLLGPILIPFLARMKFGQYVREDGPKSHRKKTGTPTMGGIVILVSVVITSFFYMGENRALTPVLFVTLGFGLIGLFDDLIKIVMRRSMGLRAWQKILCQILVTSTFGYYLVFTLDYGTMTLIPFQGGVYVNLGRWYLPMLVFTVLGTVNGVNLTDGLDGLASGVTVLVATFFSVVAVGSVSGIAPVTCAVTGSLLGFLIYNVYPARVFMGDTGSLALGGFVAATAYMLRMPFFLIIVGFVYLLEVMSVILQVGYFKLTGGKRIFKMAPVHHHLELCGWEETRIVAVFSIITALLCLLGFLAV